MGAVHIYTTVKGLVLRENRYRESDKLLTVLTAEHGKLTVKARGALRKSSRIGAAGQALCYAELTLFGNRGRWTADEGSTVEQFLGLREDLSRLALGMYFAELLDTVCPEEVPAEKTLQLGLNALYALSRGMYTPEHIKAVFELRLMCLEGFRPETGECAVCGEKNMVEPMFSPDSGVIHCRACGGSVSGGAVALDDGSLAALRHIVSAPAKREFSFSLEPDAGQRLSRVCEGFTMCQLDRRFPSLEYWKSVK